MEYSRGGYGGRGGAGYSYHHRGGGPRPNHWPNRGGSGRSGRLGEGHIGGGGSSNGGRGRISRPGWSEGSHSPIRLTVQRRGGRGGSDRGRGTHLPRAPSPSNQYVIGPQQPPSPSPPPSPTSAGDEQTSDVTLLVNHFKINYGQKLDLYSYEIILEAGSSSMSASQVPSVRDFQEAWYQLFQHKLLSKFRSKSVYDGRQMVFTTLDLGASVSSLKVNSGCFSASMSLKSKMQVPGDLEQGGLPAKEILYSIAMIIRQASRSNKIVRGSSFLSLQGIQEFNHSSVLALRGTTQALKSTEQGLVLCVDQVIAPFRKSMNMIDYIQILLGHHLQYNSSLSSAQIEELVSKLRGLRITLPHTSTPRRVYIVKGLTRSSANDLSFKDFKTGGNWSLLDYFQQVYRIGVVYKFLPCLDLSISNQKPHWVPVEVCQVQEYQRCEQGTLSKHFATRLEEISIPKPQLRKQQIINLMEAPNGPCSGPLAGHFQISVEQNMTQVTGRILCPPTLRIGAVPEGKFSVSKTGSWNLNGKKVLEACDVKCWAVIDFSSNPYVAGNSLLSERFVSGIVGACDSIGIQIARRPCAIWASEMSVLSNFNSLYDILNQMKIQNQNIEILFCALSTQHHGYETLKCICEMDLGIVSQCFLSGITSKSNWKPCYHNLALKINSKIGGSNHQLFDSLPSKISSSFMFLGADVNHPKGNLPSPSVAAVVASMDCPGGTKYVSRLRVQEHHAEIIKDIGDICCELVSVYEKRNQVKPASIIFFRDSVGDRNIGRFLKEEVETIQKFLRVDGYAPKITVILAKKGHHTRVFLKDDKHNCRSRNGNVPPGTLVDTVVVDDGENSNFYLCSHECNKGTCQPTHYYTLLDDHALKAEEIHSLVYNQCFLSAKSMKPVALAAPLYFADLAAYRGKMYVQQLQTPGTPILHDSVRDKMVFI